MFEYDQEVNNKSNERIAELSPGLKKSINKIIQSEGYITHLVYTRDISTEGGNYMSLLKEVDIKGKTVDGKKETNLFIKNCLPVSDKNVVPIKELFLREIFIYTEVAELFIEMQNKFNVPDAEKYHFVKCYNDGGDDLLIFDNMTRKGFKIYNRLEVTPLKVMELSIKQLAKFHGMSMVLKQYKPDFYRNKIQTTNNPLVHNEAGKDILKNLYMKSLEYFYDDKKIRLEKYLEGVINKYFRYLNKTEANIKCLCHGDYRMNNILVKEINGEAAAVIPIDYQTVFYSSPALDIIYMIFIGTDRQFRKNYMEHLKNIYFESLTKFLRYFDIDVESVYPRKELQNDFKSQLDYGLIISLILLPLVLAAEDDVPEINADLKTVKVHDNFKQRIVEIVEDFIEWGYL